MVSHGSRMGASCFRSVAFGFPSLRGTQNGFPSRGYGFDSRRPLQTSVKFPLIRLPLLTFSLSICAHLTLVLRPFCAQLSQSSRQESLTGSFGREVAQTPVTRRPAFSAETSRFPHGGVGAGGPWPKYKVTKYTMSVNYTAPAMRQELVRIDDERPPRGGGVGGYNPTTAMAPLRKPCGVSHMRSAVDNVTRLKLDVASVAHIHGRHQPL
jgi:hypothetical protein